FLLAPRLEPARRPGEADAGVVTSRLDEVMPVRGDLERAAPAAAHELGGPRAMESANVLGQLRPCAGTAVVEHLADPVDKRVHLLLGHAEPAEPGRPAPALLAAQG